MSLSLKPSLRFVEFDSSWEKYNLSDLGEFKNGVNKAAEDFGHGMPFVNLMDVFGQNSIGLPELDLVNSTEKERELYSIKKGDTLFIRSSVKRQGVGETAVCEHDIEDAVYSGFLIRFRSNDNIEHGFKRFCFWTPKFRNSLLRMSTTSANTNINQESLSKLKLALPTIEEQQKIADFLSSIDRKSSLLKEKYAVLAQYKKGMMRKLFKQEIRFKAENGDSFPDWQQLKVKDVTTNFSNRNKKLIEAEVYSVTNSNGFILQSAQFEGKIAGDDLSNYKVVTKGDFAYNPARINVGSIAQFHGDTAIISSLYVCFKTNSNVTDRFFSHWLDLDKTKFDIGRFGEGGVRVYLWYPLFSMIPIIVPSIQEQEKIAFFIDEIDKKLDSISHQIDLTQSFKKGLLQQMFV